MDTSLAIASSFFPNSITNSAPRSSIFPIPISSKTHHQRSNVVLKASASSSSSSSSPQPLISTLKSTGIALVFAAVAFGKFSVSTPLARAEPPPALVEEEQERQLEEQESDSLQTQFVESKTEAVEAVEEREQDSPLTQFLESKTEAVEAVEEREQDSPLAQFLESRPEAIEALKTLLQEKLEADEDEESLKILKELSDAQPESTEWNFLTARLLNEMGNLEQARDVFEGILSKNPLLFEALFENALLMDRCGEGVKAMQRLEQVLRIAEEENKVKEGRDIRFIMAQLQFLQKNVDEALRSYEELEREDPKDFRPYLCKGMIYSLLDRHKEAREQFAKYRDLSPKKFEVEGYLRTALSRMKLFGTDEQTK